MASQAISKIVSSYERMRNLAKTGKEKAKIRTERMSGGAAAVVGAALAGVADAKFRDSDGASRHILGVPAVAAGSALLAVAGMTELLPASIYIGMAGVGGLCYVVGKATYTHQGGK